MILPPSVYPAINIVVNIYREQTCTWSFYMGLTSAEGQKLECFKWTTNNVFKRSMKIYWTHYVVKSYSYFI